MWKNDRMSGQSLSQQERQQILQRLNDLHAQVKCVNQSYDLTFNERARKVIELNDEYLREVKRLQAR